MCPINIKFAGRLIFSFSLLNAYKQPFSYHKKKMDIFGNLIQQMSIPINIETFGVWIPLAFGLAVGLVYVIASGLRRPT
ncbi:MAG: hypothetical protein ACE5SW_04620 [Nitrososphaeraceae archaeon]